MIRSVSLVNGVLDVSISGQTVNYVVNTNNLTGSPAVRRETVRAALQTRFDNRILLTDLPSDDPDKTTDPNRPDIFWSDSTGNAAAATKTHCTSRSYTVSVATGYVVTFTRTN